MIESKKEDFDLLAAAMRKVAEEQKQDRELPQDHDQGDQPNKD